LPPGNFIEREDDDDVDDVRNDDDVNADADTDDEAVVVV